MSRTILKRLVMAISFMILPSYSPYLNSQNVSPNSMLNELFQKDVSSLSEFFKLYNSATGLDKTLSEEQKTRIIVSLLDASSEKNKSNMEIVRDFVNHVANSTVQLSFDQPLWCAEITANVLYKKKKAVLTLFLKPQNYGNEIYGWTLCGANQLIKSGIINDSVVRAISPTDNELEFLGLPELLQNDYLNAFGYRSNNYSIDQLSVFLFSIQQKTITVESIGEMRYHFMCLPGFAFVVEQRMKMGNSGWLITSIETIEDANNEFNNLIYGND